MKQMKIVLLDAMAKGGESSSRRGNPQPHIRESLGRGGSDVEAGSGKDQDKDKDIATDWDGGAPSLLPTASSPAHAIQRKHKHTLAILAVPRSASERIANETVLEAAITATADRLSVIVRAKASEGIDGTSSEANLAQLRRYASEVYGMAWDTVVGSVAATGGTLLNLVVYPQGLPNVSSERWIQLDPALSCVCGNESVAEGGLDEYVSAVNAWRGISGLEPLEALRVDDCLGGPNIVFLEDDEDTAYEQIRTKGIGISLEEKKEESDINEGSIGTHTTRQSPLYSSVCVGGTWDGMHYGHRKLLTLAVSSVNPIDGTLLVGVKRDEMLAGKAFASAIPTLEDRIAGVLDFIGKLAPQMKHRVRCVPMDDRTLQDWLLEEGFDALVVSHETLPIGSRLNKYRQEVLGLKPVNLLCTQRTMPNGMSSTTLRRMRSKK